MVLKTDTEDDSTETTPERRRRQLERLIAETDDRLETVGYLVEIERTYMSERKWTRAKQVHDIYKEKLSEKEYRALWTPIENLKGDAQ